MKYLVVYSHMGFVVFSFCEEIKKLSSEIFMIELISTTYNLSLIGILLAGVGENRE